MIRPAETMSVLSSYLIRADERFLEQLRILYKWCPAGPPALANEAEYKLQNRLSHKWLASHVLCGCICNGYFECNYNYYITGSEII
jgi:hypothetical protein